MQPNRVTTRTALLAAVSLLAGVLAVTVPGQACTGPTCNLGPTIQDLKEDATRAAQNAIKAAKNTPVARTPVGPVCAGCLVKAIQGAISVIRTPGVGAKAPAKYTYISAPRGKVTTWTAPSASSSSASAMAQASSSGCSDLSCYNASYRSDAPVSVEDSNVRLYGVMTLLQPDIYTGGSYFALIYMKSASTTKRDGPRIRTLLDRVAEVQAPSSFITDWSPEGSADWGSAHTNGFQIGGSFEGTGFSVGRTWTSFPGRVEGQAPANGGKVFTGSWSGKLSNGTAPFIGGATYRVTVGEPSYYEYYLETTYNP